LNGRIGLARVDDVLPVGRLDAEPAVEDEQYLLAALVVVVGRGQVLAGRQFVDRGRQNPEVGGLGDRPAIAGVVGTRLDVGWIDDRVAHGPWSATRRLIRWVRTGRLVPRRRVSVARPARTRPG